MTPPSHRGQTAPEKARAWRRTLHYLSLFSGQFAASRRLTHCGQPADREWSSFVSVPIVKGRPIGPSHSLSEMRRTIGTLRRWTPCVKRRFALTPQCSGIDEVGACRRTPFLLQSVFPPGAGQDPRTITVFAIEGQLRRHFDSPLAPDVLRQAADTAGVVAFSLSAISHAWPGVEALLPLTGISELCRLKLS